MDINGYPVLQPSQLNALNVNSQIGIKKEISMPKTPNKNELEFADSLEAQGKAWVFEPQAFDLGIKRPKQKGNITYTPDFYCPEDNCYYEITGSKAAYNENKWKLLLFQKLYPHLNFKIIRLCCTLVIRISPLLMEAIDKAVAIADTTKKDWVTKVLKAKVKAQTQEATNVHKA